MNEFYPAVALACPEIILRGRQSGAPITACLDQFNRHDRSLISPSESLVVYLEYSVRAAVLHRHRVLYVQDPANNLTSVNIFGESAVGVDGVGPANESTFRQLLLQPTPKLWNCIPERLAGAGVGTSVCAATLTAELGSTGSPGPNRKLPGTSPENVRTEFQCTNCPPGGPLKYFAFPRSEISDALGPRYNDSGEITFRPDGFGILACEGLHGKNPADSFYQFSRDLEIRSARFSDTYWDVHRQLEIARGLSHARARCPDRDGPATIQRWTLSSGWTTIHIDPSPQ